MTTLRDPRRFSGENHRSLAWLLALVPARLAAQSAVAQMPARFDPLRSTTRLSDAVSKNPQPAVAPCGGVSNAEPFNIYVPERRTNQVLSRRGPQQSRNRKS